MAHARMTAPAEPLLVAVSVGELADKITILEIKTQRIADPAKLCNIRAELEQLRAVWDSDGMPDGTRYADSGGSTTKANCGRLNRAVEIARCRELV